MVYGESINAMKVKPGQELVDLFLCHATKEDLIQYDYRSEEGNLFTTIGRSLEGCRKWRDEWLAKGQKPQGRGRRKFER